MTHQTHELKCWPEPFQAIRFGFKAHEIRKCDRPFRCFDSLLLREWNPETKEYTGAELTVTVTHLTPPGQWGLPSDVCVMSIRLGVEDAISAAVAEAREEEREAIAKMVEKAVGEPCPLEGIKIVCSDKLAAAIRARSQP